MKDEIKEILDRLERIDHKEYIAFEFADSATFDEMARCFEERKKLADYITNLQKENKQLKDKIENIKDFNNKLQASKDRLDKDDYNLAHILTELEEWIKSYLYMLNGITDKDIYEKQQLDDFADFMDKIQKLKEKYK